MPVTLGPPPAVRASFPQICCVWRSTPRPACTPSAYTHVTTHAHALRRACRSVRTWRGVTRRHGLVVLADTHWRLATGRRVCRAWAARATQAAARATQRLQAEALRRHHALHRVFVGLVVFRLTRRLTRRVVAECLHARAPRVLRAALGAWRGHVKGSRRRAALSTAAARWHAATRTSRAFAGWRAIAQRGAGDRARVLAHHLQVRWGGVCVEPTDFTCHYYRCSAR
jgi:hypothetical protein